MNDVSNVLAGELNPKCEVFIAILAKLCLFFSFSAASNWFLSFLFFMLISRLVGGIY